MGTGLIVVGAVALAVLFFLSKTIIVVRQAQTMVVERLGKYNRTLSSGINLIMPMVDQPRAIDWHSVISLPSGETITRRYPPPRSICARPCTSSRART